MARSFTWQNPAIANTPHIQEICFRDRPPQKLEVKVQMDADADQIEALLKKFSADFSRYDNVFSITPNRSITPERLMWFLHEESLIALECLNEMRKKMAEYRQKQQRDSWER